MTDREIIKVFELYKSTCIIRAADRNWSITIGDVLDLIKRYEAEIERLQKAIAVIDIMEAQHKYDLKKAKAEAIKEYAERLKDVFKDLAICTVSSVTNKIDDVLEEMAGEGK